MCRQWRTILRGRQLWTDRKNEFTTREESVSAKAANRNAAKEAGKVNASETCVRTRLPNALLLYTCFQRGL